MLGLPVFAGYEDMLPAGCFLLCPSGRCQTSVIARPDWSFLMLTGFAPFTAAQPDVRMIGKKGYKGLFLMNPHYFG
jgi:hypothetical protein